MKKGLKIFTIIVLIAITIIEFIIAIPLLKTCNLNNYLLLTNKDVMIYNFVKYSIFTIICLKGLIEVGIVICLPKKE